MTVLQAILIGVVYYLGSAPWAIGYLTVCKPLVAGTLVGCILGAPAEGAIMGATIQLIYLGWMSVGGSQPSDPALAGTLATALAIASHLDTGVALTLSVPLGMLGTFVWVGRNTFNVVISHMADKPTREANTRGIWRVNVLYPQPVLLLMTVLPRRARRLLRTRVRPERARFPRHPRARHPYPHRRRGSRRSASRSTSR